MFLHVFTLFYWSDSSLDLLVKSWHDCKRIDRDDDAEVNAGESSMQSALRHEEGMAKEMHHSTLTADTVNHFKVRKSVFHRVWSGV